MRVSEKRPCQTITPACNTKLTIGNRKAGALLLEILSTDAGEIECQGINKPLQVHLNVGHGLSEKTYEVYLISEHFWRTIWYRKAWTGKQFATNRRTHPGEVGASYHVAKGLQLREGSIETFWWFGGPMLCIKSRVCENIALSALRHSQII